MTTLGAQYYRPPNPPRADWRRDLERMRDSGMNTVKLWACWSWINVRDGEYDWADLDELVVHAQRVGLSVVVNTIIENAPYWLEASAPHARYVDSEGRQLHLTAAMNTPGGGWPGLCFDNDEVWAAATDFLRALTTRFAGEIDVWDVWNEPHLEPASYFPDRLYCYCEASVARFIDWLKTRYGTLDALNSAWSRRFSDWSQVQPPRLFEAVPDMLDWRAFWFDNLERWLRRRVELVREAVPGATVMTHVALSGFTGQLATHTLDEFRLTRDVDIFGTSSFPTWLMGDDHVEHLFNLDTARDAAPGLPFWQAELQGGRGRRDGDCSTGQPRASVVTMWMWNALAAGATGVMFWQWRPELLGPESPGYGLTTADGSSTDRVEAVAEFAVVASLPELEGRRVVPPTVGLVVSRLTALHAFATDRSMALYRDAVLGAYRALTDANVPVQFVHEDQIERSGVPDSVRALYWPMPSVASAATVAAVASFVALGGRLVAEAGPGEYAPTGHRRATVPPAALAEIFGVREVETTSVGAGERATTHWGELDLAWQREIIEPTTAQVRGEFRDGTPAVVEHRSGGGSTVLIAGYPSIAYARGSRVGTSATLAAIVGPRAELDSDWVNGGIGLVTRTAIAADGSLLTFALNWTNEDARFRLAAGAKVLSGPAAENGFVDVPGLTAALIVDTR